MRTYPLSLAVATAVAAITLISAPRGWADQIGDAQAAIQKVKDAETEAAGTIPGNRTLKKAEDDLDAAARKNDDVKADPNASERAKKIAQDAEDKARERADFVHSGSSEENQEKATGYRKALEKRRVARRELIPVLATVRELLRGFSRQEAEPVVREGNAVLKRSDEPIPYPKTTTSSARTHAADTAQDTASDTARHTTQKVAVEAASKPPPTPKPKEPAKHVH